MPFWEYPHEPTDPDLLQHVFKSAYDREYDPIVKEDWRLMGEVLILCSIAWLSVGDYSYDFDKRGPYSHEIWEDMKKSRKNEKWKLSKYDQGKLDSVVNAIKEFQGPPSILARVAYAIDHGSYYGHEATTEEVRKRFPDLDTAVIENARKILKKHKVFRIPSWK